MSKIRKHKYDDEDDFDAYDYDEYRNKKRNKRIKSALKTKSIEDLIHLSEEDDDYY